MRQGELGTRTFLELKKKKGKTEKTKQKVVDYSVETKLLDPLQQLSNDQPFPPD